MGLDTAFAALADPTRRAIVERLARSELSVTDLVEPFGLSQPTISHHLRVLSEGGIVTRRNHGTRRIYRLNATALNALDSWISQLRTTMDGNYERLDQLLTTMKESKK